MELIFVYNAHESLSSRIIDFAHKIIRPQTYDCALCSLTHHHFGAYKAWKAFQESADVPFHFYHIEGFEKHYNTSYPYPTVLALSNEEFDVVLDPTRFQTIKDTNALIAFLQHYLKDYRDTKT